MGCPEWAPYQSKAEQVKNSKAIDQACRQVMLNSYYIPFLALKASEEQRSQGTQQALDSYLTLAKFCPNYSLLTEYLLHLQEKATTIAGKQFFQKALISILPIYLKLAHSNVSELRLRGFNGYLTWVQYRDDMATIQQAERIIDAALLEFPNGQVILGNTGRIYCYLLDNVKGFDFLHRLVEIDTSPGPFIALAKAYFHFGHKVTDAPEMQALKWCTRAAESGHPMALAFLKELKSLIKKSPYLPIKHKNIWRNGYLSI